jgi:hypothetical protein
LITVSAYENDVYPEGQFKFISVETEEERFVKQQFELM